MVRLEQVPPYALSYSAAKGGTANADFESSLFGASHTRSTVVNLAIKITRWMLTLLERHGFLAVVALSSWPNVAFDICGMACGYFMMPFWKFFAATLVGKAGIKVYIYIYFNRKGPTILTLDARIYSNSQAGILTTFSSSAPFHAIVASCNLGKSIIY